MKLLPSSPCRSRQRRSRKIKVLKRATGLRLILSFSIYCCDCRLKSGVALDVRLDRPLIGVGAPVGAFLPEAAAKLSTRLIIPEHAEVANAFGAITGRVVERTEVTIRPHRLDGFNLHGHRRCSIDSTPWRKLWLPVKNTLGKIARRRSRAKGRQRDRGERNQGGNHDAAGRMRGEQGFS